MFICGSASFSHQDEDEAYISSYPTPKRTKKSYSFCRINGKYNINKNPYANRGLDKFYTLLTELDDKRQKIYAQMGSEAISFVQFVYSKDSDHLKPIVVKVKEKKQEANKTNVVKNMNDNNSTNNAINPAINRSISLIKSDQVLQPQEKKQESDLNKQPEKKRHNCQRCKESLVMKLENLRQPYFYFPIMVMLILLFLAVFGRSFAILCTSIGWYLIPSIKGSETSNSSSNAIRKPKGKVYDRKLSEIKSNGVNNNEGPSSPTSVINGLALTAHQKQRSHGKIDAAKS